MTARIDPAAISESAGDVVLEEVWKPQKRPPDGGGEQPSYHTPRNQSEAVTGLPKRSGMERRWIAVERHGEVRHILVEQQKKRKR